MKLTKNERKTLKLLLENAKMSDSAISDRLGITSQAVGKIRKKLEKDVINSYTVDLDYAKLGIKTFAFAIAKLTADGLDKGDLEIEKKLLEDPHVIQTYRVPSGNATHLILYGFRDMNELDDFFYSSQKRKELHRFIESKELFTFSHNSLLKNSPVQLFHNVIDNVASKEGSLFAEIEAFRKNLKL